MKRPYSWYCRQNEWLWCVLQQTVVQGILSSRCWEWIAGVSVKILSCSFGVIFSTGCELINLLRDLYMICLSNRCKSSIFCIVWTLSLLQYWWMLILCLSCLGLKKWFCKPVKHHRGITVTDIMHAWCRFNQTFAWFNIYTILIMYVNSLFHCYSWDLLVSFNDYSTHGLCFRGLVFLRPFCEWM